MATKSKGKKASKAKPDPVDELEAELEGLEEVEIDEDEDEPDVEEEETDDEDEDDESVDYDSMKNRDLKDLLKARGVKGADKANKAKLVALAKASDNASDDEEEDEDEIEVMDRVALKARLKELGLPNAKKSESDDDLRARVRDAVGDDEDDEEEDDEEEEEDDGYDEMERAELRALLKQRGLPNSKKSESDDEIRARIREDDLPKPDTPKAAAKKAAAKGGKKNSQPVQLTRVLPAGKLGANDIATMAGGNTNALGVRNFLRNNKEKFPKNAELGRYAFTEAQARKIVAAMGKGKGKK